MSKKVIGIDVGKKDLYLAHKYFTTTGKVKVKRKKFSNNLKGYKALIEWSKNIAKKEGSKSLHFIMEATGVYYEGIAYFLFEKGFAVSVINPSYIKSFANSSVSMAKKFDPLSDNKIDPPDPILISQFFP